MEDKKDINEYMFRYLEKYTGKYRVRGFYDLETLKYPKDESFEDLYIQCGRSQAQIKHTYRDFDCLAVCFYDKQPSVAQRAYDEIMTLNPTKEVVLENNGSDSYIYFYDADMDKIAKVMKPRTNGAKIKWSSKRNLPKGKK